MKPVFKCDHCDFMGTEEEVKRHEPICRNNYDVRGCYTCKHRGELKSVEDGFKYECYNGKEIPINSIYQFCEKYDEKERPKYSFFNIFNNFGF